MFLCLFERIPKNDARNGVPPPSPPGRAEGSPSIHCVSSNTWTMLRWGKGPSVSIGGNIRLDIGQWLQLNEVPFNVVESLRAETSKDLDAIRFTAHACAFRRQVGNASTAKGIPVRGISSTRCILRRRGEFRFSRARDKTLHRHPQLESQARKKN